MRTMVAALLLVVTACAPSLPLQVDEDAPDDVTELAGEVADVFFAAFSAHRSCGGGVRLETSRELDDRAVYHAGRATVTLRIPWTAPRLSQTLAHELAHHLEAACPSHRELRPVFLTALGQAPDGPWFEAETWEEIPSEIYAETASVVALGDDTDTRIPVDPELVDLVRRWGEGADLTHSPSAP